MMLRLARGSVEIGERHSVVGCLGYIRGFDGWMDLVGFPRSSRVPLLISMSLLKFHKYSFILLFIE